MSSYVTNTSLTSSLSNYAQLNSPVFGSSPIFFLSTSNGGWNIGYSSSSFGISLNNVIQALSIDNTEYCSGISGYSTTKQVNSIFSNSLTN